MKRFVLVCQICLALLQIVAPNAQLFRIVHRRERALKENVWMHVSAPVVKTRFVMLTTMFRSVNACREIIKVILTMDAFSEKVSENNYFMR